MLTNRKKKNIITKHQTHEQDTGSPEVQISILTSRINELAKHLKTHKKDTHSRRGLLQLVAKRQRHMNYLKRKSPERYGELMDELGLKKK